MGGGNNFLSPAAALEDQPKDNAFCRKNVFCEDAWIGSGRGPLNGDPDGAGDEEPPRHRDGEAAEQAKRSETALNRVPEGIERNLHRRASSRTSGSSRNGRSACRFGPDGVPERHVRQPIGRCRTDVAMAEPHPGSRGCPDAVFGGEGGLCSTARRKGRASNLQQGEASVPKSDGRPILRESF